MHTKPGSEFLTVHQLLHLPGILNLIDLSSISHFSQVFCNVTFWTVDPVTDWLQWTPPWPLIIHV